MKHGVRYGSVYAVPVCNFMASLTEYSVSSCRPPHSPTYHSLSALKRDRAGSRDKSTSSKYTRPTIDNTKRIIHNSLAMPVTQRVDTLQDGTAASLDAEQPKPPSDRANRRSSTSNVNHHSHWKTWLDEVFRLSKKALMENRTYPLVVCVPLGLLAGLFGWHPVMTSTFNFLAIIPLSALVSEASDALSVPDLASGLINASFGNAVELSVRFLSPLPRLHNHRLML
jgi:hypothetical protein